MKALTAAFLAGFILFSSTVLGQDKATGAPGGIVLPQDINTNPCMELIAGQEEYGKRIG